MRPTDPNEYQEHMFNRAITRIEKIAKFAGGKPIPEEVLIVKVQKKRTKKKSKGY